MEKINIEITKDGIGFLALIPELNVHSYADTLEQVLEFIKQNILDLIEDLQKDDDFSPDWLEVKAKLLKFIQ